MTWLVEAIEAGGQALAFTRTRQAAELIHRYVARSSSKPQRSPLADKVRAYRGGYLPNERREIEQDLFSGNLRGVAATNALELGIDIGSLDVALLVNYPGTIASSWQQAGRSGRRHDESLAVLLAGNDPVDQYLLRHPEYFFAQSPEHAVVDPENPYVLAKHLPAAAFELPLDESDLERLRPARRRRSPARCATTAQLAEVKRQVLFRRRAEPGGRRQPAAHERQHVQHRAAQADCDGRRRHAPPGSPRRRSKSSPTSMRSARRSSSIPRPSTCTTAKRTSCASSIWPARSPTSSGARPTTTRRPCSKATCGSRASARRATRCRDAPLGYGDVDVTWQTVAFKKIKFATRENIGLGPVDIPAQNLQTTAVWLAPDDAVRARDEGRADCGRAKASSGCATWRSSRCRWWRCATAATWAAWSTARTSAARR